MTIDYAVFTVCITTALWLRGALLMITKADDG